MPKPRSSWLSLEPGQLQHQIQIQSGIATQDAAGQQQTSWATIWTTWASIRSLSLRELDQANQVTSQVSHMITLRYRPDMSVMAGMRVLYASHVYKVQAVDNVEERGQILRLLALELNGVE